MKERTGTAFRYGTLFQLSKKEPEQHSGPKWTLVLTEAHVIAEMLQPMSGVVMFVCLDVCRQILGLYSGCGPSVTTSSHRIHLERPVLWPSSSCRVLLARQALWPSRRVLTRPVLWPSSSQRVLLARPLFFKVFDADPVLPLLRSVHCVVFNSAYELVNSTQTGMSLWMNGSTKPFSLPSYVVVRRYVFGRHNTVKEHLHQQDQTEIKFTP